MKCVLCLQPFASAPDEHLLPNAVGWRYATSRWVCACCNAATSSFDAAVAKSVRPLVTLINPPGRRQPPSVMNLPSDWSRVIVGPGGSVEMPPAVPFIASSGEEMMSVSDEHREEFEAKMLARRKRVEWVGHADVLKHVVGFDFEFEMNLIRSLAKSAIHAAAIVVGHRGATTGAASRRLSAWVLGEAPEGAVDDLIAWDWDTPEMAAAPFYHGVEVISCATKGTLAVRVHVFGVVRDRFLLDDRYAGKKHCVTTRVEMPLTTCPTRDERACEHPLSFLLMRQRGNTYMETAVRDYLSANAAAVLPPGSTDFRNQIPDDWGGPPV